LTLNSELEMAQQVQRSILPRETPKVPGLEITARYIPMSSLAGDFYDFLVVDEKHVGILIADVAGHGLPSALIASMLQTALAAQFPHASDPAGVLSGLNQALYGKFQNYFVTAAYVFLDMNKNTVQYAGAAHPPLLLRRARTRETIEYLQNGLMLGPFSHATYSALSFAQEIGDRIVLITDGIVEAADSSGDQFGMRRLKEIVDSHHDLPATGFADALFRSLSSWSERAIGASQSDDITLLVVDFKSN
jgi:phosphoserine phosphatase RsbU/P